MALNPSIIMSGQQFDLGRAMSDGLALAQQRKAFDQQRAQEELFRTQGQGIVSGDPAALGALAQMDPAAALGIQQTQQTMAFQAEDQQMQRDQARREVEEMLRAQADTLNAAEVAAEAQWLERVLSGAAFHYQNKDEPRYAAFLQSQGVDPTEYRFEDYPAHAAMFGGAMDAMNAFAQPAPPDPNDRYKVVGGTLFDLAADGGPAPVGQGAMQETMVMGPDGKPIMVQGGPGTTAKFTEGQSKDNVYATRAEGALAKLEAPIEPSAPDAGTYADTLTSRSGKIGEGLNTITMGYSREMLQTEEFQTATTAGKEFVYAILRKDTGAAITNPEELMYFDVYLPQPGDLPGRLKFKAEARQRAVAAIKAGMSQQQLNAVTSALNSGDVQAADKLIAQASGEQATVTTGAPAATGAPQGPLSDEDLLRMYGGE